MKLGACRGEDPELFFPGRGETMAVRRAKAICSQCPVRSECLEYALANPHDTGIWGVTSDRQRRQIRTDRFRQGRPRPPRPRLGAIDRKARITPGPYRVGGVSPPQNVGYNLCQKRGSDGYDFSAG
jgi:hypothetical protein